MKNELIINRHIKLIAFCFLITLMLPSITLANDTKDTVIIELNDSKIIIVTKNQEDLATLENYDINQMIKDLNMQLSDSITYIEINNDKAYINKGDGIKMKEWEINDDKVSIKLGNVEVDINPDEVDEWDDDFWKSHKKTTYDTNRIDRTTHHFNVDIGLNNWLEDGNFPVGNAPYAIKPFGSWYVGLNSTNRTWLSRAFFLEWSFGIHWYNWKLEDTDYIIQEGEEKIEFNLSPTDQNGTKSKLTASFINVAIIPMFDFSKGRRKITRIKSKGLQLKKYSRKGFRFGIGGYVGYRIGSHTKFKYREKGNKEKDKKKDDFYLENLRYGIRAQIGWKGLELFGAYDLNNVFSEGHGPELSAVSFGITL